MIKFPFCVINMATKAQYCWAKAPLWQSQKLPMTCLEQRFFHTGLKSSSSSVAWQKSQNITFPLACRKISSSSEKQGRKSSKRLVIFGIGTAVIASLGFYYSSKRSRNSGMMETNTTAPGYKEFSNLVSKKYVNQQNLKPHMTLFQYEPCPFCKKVRSFLDCYGFSYDIVEVNSVTKKELGWSSYKKVPIILIGDEHQSQQLNDSTLIISLLASYLHDPEQDIKNLLKCYPVMSQTDSKGVTKSEIMNKYFVMFGDKPPADRTSEEVVSERRWRKWCDNVLVHTLSPNVYRTWGEALETFKMFDKNGDWDRVFSSFERSVVIYLGAAVMFLLSKGLKRKHNISQDCRQSLYEAVNTFLGAIAKQGTLFLGGNAPNLADLAAYGVLNSIEGTLAFKDLVENTEVLSWYSEVKRVIESRRGEMVAP